MTEHYYSIFNLEFCVHHETKDMSSTCICSHFDLVLDFIQLLPPFIRKGTREKEQTNVWTIRHTHTYIYKYMAWHEWMHSCI